MELVEAVSALPAAERSAWLSLQCPDEPALVAEVMDRVEWEAKMGDFLRDPIVVRSLSRAEAFAPGALVAGRYRIAREIGRFSRLWILRTKTVSPSSFLRPRALPSLRPPTPASSSIWNTTRLILWTVAPGSPPLSIWKAPLWPTGFGTPRP